MKRNCSEQAGKLGRVPTLLLRASEDALPGTGVNWALATSACQEPDPAGSGSWEWEGESARGFGAHPHSIQPRLSPSSAGPKYRPTFPLPGLGH